MSTRDAIRMLEDIQQKMKPNSTWIMTTDEVEMLLKELRAPDSLPKPDELRLARAEKHHDCRHLTAQDILLETLQLVRAVPDDRGVRMVICWHTFDKAEPDGGVETYERMAGMTNSRLIATLFAMAASYARAWAP